MKRRQFIKAAAVSGISVVSIGAVYLNIKSEDKSKLSIDYALEQLAQLSQTEIHSTGKWNAYQIFTHCAQSVEFSMLGFPEHKSAFFKASVGTAAFAIFASKGRMNHSLNENIPGAASVVRMDNKNKAENITLDVEQALSRLKKSLMDFKAYNKALAPHFAYGDLTKQEYELAHVMHLNNHLSEIQMVG